MRLLGTPPYTYEQPYDLFEGAKIRFYGERQAYTVICTSKRYTICTKPLNIHHTVLYCIIDWEEQIRGPEDLIFGMGAETKEQCLNMLIRLTDGHPERSEVSHRHRAWLHIEKLWQEDHIMIGEQAETSNQYIDRVVAKSIMVGAKIARNPGQKGKLKTI